MDTDREARLLSENEDLREEVRQLKSLLHNHFEFPESWRLWPIMTRLLSTLMTVEFISIEQISSTLYREDERGPNAVPQLISLLRRRLPGGVEINYIHGVGYRITPQHKIKLRRYAMKK